MFGKMRNWGGVGSDGGEVFTAEIRKPQRRQGREASQRLFLGLR